MKRLLAGTLAAALALGLTGCGQQQEECDAKPVIYLYPSSRQRSRFRSIMTEHSPRPIRRMKTAGVSPPSRTAHCMTKTETNTPTCSGREKTMPTMTFQRASALPVQTPQIFSAKRSPASALTPREYNEFIVYWLPKMQGNPYNLISFQSERYTDGAKLTIDPKPDSELRVFMAWKPLNRAQPIEPQTFPSFERDGFTVVEWGGCEVTK